MTFQASQFTPTKWSTAQDKAAFAKQFVHFVRSDFAEKRFTEKFYLRLCNLFGFIAHYNRRGFYDTFFTTTADKVRFLEMALRWSFGGDSAWTFGDVERALQQWLKADGALERYRQRLAKETEATERAQLAMLQRKYA